MTGESNGIAEHEKPGFNLESLVPEDAFKDDDPDATENGAPAGSKQDASMTEAAAKSGSANDAGAETTETSTSTFEVDGKSFPRAGARSFIFSTLDDPESSILARVVGGFIMLLIFLGSLTFVLETIPDIKERFGEEMEVFEAVCVVAFTADYVLRVLTCTARSPPNGLCSYLREPLNVVDIISILPWYMERLLQMGGSIAILRVLRMARVFRVMRHGSLVDDLEVFSKGLVQATPGLTLLFFMLMIYLVVFGAFLNMLEDQAHRSYPCGTVDTSTGCVPEGKDGFESIPAAIWFVLATLTTVGYGDVYPLTVGGKLVSMACMLTGILVLALPIVLVGNAFQDVFDQRQKSQDPAKQQKGAHEAGSRDTVANPLGNGSQHWSLEAERMQEQRRSRKQVVIGLLARLADDSNDPCYEKCIELLSSTAVHER